MADTTSDTSDTTTSKTRTITLTDRPPVRIAEADWPLVGESHFLRQDNQPNPPNQETKAAIRVRRHADGRALIYGTYEYWTNYQGARGDSFRGGVLLDAGRDVIRAIHEVGDVMARRAVNEASAPWARLVAECITSLPPESI